ncbi:MAG: Ig-like domain-containing protein [Terracidiphilus sp.]
MRGFLRRGLRLQLVAAFSIALVLPSLTFAAESIQRQASQTALTVQTRDQDGHTQATLAVSVTGEDGLPATGAVAISDDGQPLAGAALNAKGQASIVLTLPAGDHSLTATYIGDAAHSTSVSEPAVTAAAASATPNFTVAVSPGTLSLTAGQSGTITASITPVNSSSLTAPMFITLSCSGLPDQATCTFTPENIEILPNATAAIAIPMVIGTQAAGGPSAVNRRFNPVSWAFLMPGALALGGLAWSSRRRAWLNRLSLLALVGLVAMLGTTACAPRYNYFNHGPPPPLPTPAGNYTVQVTAQSSNGVTAITNSTTLALTVK